MIHHVNGEPHTWARRGGSQRLRGCHLDLLQPFSPGRGIGKGGVINCRLSIYHTVFYTVLWYVFSCLAFLPCFACLSHISSRQPFSGRARTSSPKSARHWSPQPPPHAYVLAHTAEWTFTINPRHPSTPHLPHHHHHTPLVWGRSQEKRGSPLLYVGL